MALQYHVLPVTSFSQNCSIVWCDVSNKAIVVDPGGDVAAIRKQLEQLSVDVVSIVLTHGHLDHVGGATDLASKLKVDIIGPHKADNFWLQGLPGQSQMFNFPLTEAFEPTQWLEEGDTVECGNELLSVIHTPGHTPGHVVLYSDTAKLAFVGDVLFNGSIGRTDFPKGDFDTLINSIKQKLWPLGDEVKFVPGHGPESTFGRERRSNPFVADEMPLY